MSKRHTYPNFCSTKALKPPRYNTSGKKGDPPTPRDSTSGEKGDPSMPREGTSGKKGDPSTPRDNRSIKKGTSKPHSYCSISGNMAQNEA